MRIHLKNGNCELTKDFPKNLFGLQDILARLHQSENRNVLFSFDCYTEKNILPPELLNREFRTDIFKLKVFTEQLETMTPVEHAAYKAVLKVNAVSDFDELLQMTYNLESVPMIKASCFSELGTFAVEQEMLPEIKNCPSELLEYLDTEKLGRLMAERNEGVFIDDYYCEPEMYEKLDIHIEIGEPETCFFRLLLAPRSSDKHLAEWISLPCEEPEFEEKICLQWESSLPNLRISQRPEQAEIVSLNHLAERLTHLDNYELVKLKAVMEHEEIQNIAGTIDCIKHLHEYDFDALPCNRNEFGKLYLMQNIPVDFPVRMFADVDMSNFGGEILHQKQGEVTSYGILSGRNQVLYAGLTAEPEQAENEDETEEFAMNMGGICQ